MEKNLSPETPAASNFIRQIVEDDLRTGTNGDRVATRFPPEPNGFLHIGHAKSICLNFGIARDFQGVCHLRFDDTNPETEDMKYVRAIQEDVRWLGFDWEEHLYFASDYYEELYEMAVDLIEQGKAYVDSLSGEAISEYRGTVTEPGRPSPHRTRSVEENLDLFRRMKDGEFADGEHVLRAMIDMASPNMLMRDPVIYRIKRFEHYRRGIDWVIFPLYDFAHPLSDALEGITHSICTLEFEVHRPLYDWLVENVRRDWEPRPFQYEFARLNIDYTVMSKRKFLTLVNDGYVDGWDDPRMPTIAGLRRRGYTPKALRAFCDMIGVAKADSRVDIAMLEYAIRNDLNYRAPRVMAVLDPLKVVLTNYPEDQVEDLDASYWPHDIPKEGHRVVPFSRELYIERSDFMEEPTKKFFRLAPGREVRLRHAYIIRCDEVVKDDDGTIVELRCSVDFDSRSGMPGASRRVKGTLHWVSARHAFPAEVRLYDRLFRVPNPDQVEEGQTFLDHLNPDSKRTITAMVEPSLRTVKPGEHVQFERQGFFFVEPEDSSEGAPVFNRVVTLRDTWAKVKEDAPAAKKKSTPKARRTASSESASAKQREPRTSAQEAVYQNLVEEHRLSEQDADVLATNDDYAAFFSATLAYHGDAGRVANWVINELAGIADGDLSDFPFGPAEFGELLDLLDARTINARIAKDVLDAMVRTGTGPKAIVEAKGLTQITDTDALEAIVDGLLAKFPGKVEAYRGGKTGLIGFFVGQAMRETGGKANAKLVKQLVAEKLG